MSLVLGWLFIAGLSTWFVADIVFAIGEIHKD